MYKFMKQLKTTLVNIAFLLEDPIETDVLKSLRQTIINRSCQFRETINNLVGMVREEEDHVHLNLIDLIEKREHAWRNLRHDFAVEQFKIKMNSIEVI